MFGKRNILSLLTVSAVLLLALGCQPSQPVPLGTPKPAEKAAATPAKVIEKPVSGGTLRIVAPAEPESLDAQATTMFPPTSVMYDMLIQQNEKQDVTKEGVIKDWTVSGDGKAITLRLQEGVKFHDGTDLDAAAVRFNIERMLDPASKSPYRSNWETVDTVEVVDKTTVRLKLKVIDPLMISRMVLPGGYMVSPAAVKKYGIDFGRNPVGSGPFQFVEWVPGDRIVLKRFEGYWRKDQDGNRLPYLDQVVFKIITDQAVAFANLRTGQVDLVVGFPSEQLSPLKADPNLTYKVQSQPNYQAVYLNTKRSPFDNKAVRQAVALAVDREGIVSLAGEGATLLASVFHPINWGNDEKAGLFPARDLAKAKAKMAEAGYPSGGLKVKYTSGNSVTAIREAEVIKANLAEIGIEVEIEALASAAHTTKVRLEQNYQMANGSTGLGIADPGHFFGIALHGKGSRNYYGPYSNPKVDEAIDKAGVIYDQKQREALYQEAARMVSDDVPFIPLWFANTFAGMNKKVRNFIQYPVNDRQGLRQTWLAP